MSFKDQINKFIGKVRISDIENSFNFIIENINNFIDMINNGSDFLENTDNFYLGSTSIPAGNYTLTLGALKKILEAYDKEVIGGVVVKNPLDTDKAILFPSLKISKDSGISQILQTEIDKPSQADITTNPEVGKVIGYDTVNDTVTNQNNVIVNGDVVEEQVGETIANNSTVACNGTSTVWDGGSSGTLWDITFTYPDNNDVLIQMNASYHYYGSVDHITYTGNVRGVWMNYLLADNTGNVLHQDTISVGFDAQNPVYSDDYITMSKNDGIYPKDEYVAQGAKICVKALSLIIDSEIASITFGGREVYSLTSGGTIILPSGETNPDIIKIADIDWNRDEWVMNTTDDWLYVNPEISPLIKLTTQSPPRGSAVNPDNTKPQFIIPRRMGTYRGERGDNNGGLVRLSNGSNIIDNNHTNYDKARNRSIDFVYAPVWVPQGMASTIFPIYGCSIAQYYTLSQN